MILMCQYIYSKMLSLSPRNGLAGDRTRVRCEPGSEVGGQRLEGSPGGAKARFASSDKPARFTFHSGEVESACGSQSR
jgi:hypothetical protein